MPTYTLRGVDIEFPYEAYDCQVRQKKAEKVSELRGILLPWRRSFPPSSSSAAFFDLLTLSHPRFQNQQKKPVTNQIAYMEQVVKALQDVRLFVLMTPEAKTEKKEKRRKDRDSFS